MREIKFRGWYSKINGGVMMQPNFNGPINEVFNDPNNTAVYMQYTGLKDKHGKEIYEGDIICYNYGKTESRAKMIAKWVDAGFVLSAYKENWVYDLGECVPTTLEVIGNIYENPELLEVSS